MKKIIISVLIISILVISLALGQQIIKEPIIKEPIINDPIIDEPTPIFDVLALDSSKENTVTRIRTLTNDIILTEKTLTKVYEKEEVSLVSSNENTFNKLLISDRYVSAEAIIIEPVIVRIQTNKSNTVFGVYKHPSYGVSSDVVLNDGYFFKEVISNDKGVVEFLVDSFSTIYLGIPSLYFDTSGIDNFMTTNIHDYTNKEVYAVAIPNYADSYTQLVFPTPDLTTLVFIDGFGYAVQEDVNEFIFYVEQASSDIIQKKQITILFTDGTMGSFMFYSHYLEPSNTGIYPNNIVMDYSEIKTIDISQFISKSDFLLTGYKNVNLVVLMDGESLVSATRINRIEGHIDINGNGMSETSEVKLVLRQNRYIDIYSKTTDFNYDIQVTVSNWFGITKQLRTISNVRPNIDVSDTTPYSPTTLQLTTLTPYNVGSTYATVRGRIDNLASDGLGGVVPVDVRFEYREIGTNIWKTTPYQALGVTTPSHYSYELSGLKTSKSYEYRITAISNTGTTRASSNSFTTLSVPVVQKPVILNQLPSVFLEAVNSQSITIGNYFSGHDYIDVFIEGVGQTHILNRPSSGSNNVVITDTDLEYEVQYSSNGIITIIHREGNKNPLLTVIAGNSAGTSTITRYLTLTDPSLTPPTSGVDLLNGLVSYWDGSYSSTTATDVHGSNDGTASNSHVLNADGKILKGFDFTQGNDEITTTMTGVDIGSVSIWFNPNVDIIGSSGAGKLIDFDTDSNDYNQIFLGTWSNVGTPNSAMNIPTAGSSTGYFWTWANLGLTNNKWVGSNWYHLVVVWDSTNSNYRAFVNGDDKGLATIVGTPSRSTQFKNPKLASSSGYLMSILMDELAIYDRTLNSNEVSTLYDIQKDGFESGSYPFEVLELSEVNVLSTITTKTMDLSSTLSITITDHFENHNVYNIESTKKGVISQGSNFDDADIRYDLFNDELLITSKTSEYNDTISVSASNELGTETLTFNLFVSDEGDYTGVIDSIPIQVIPISGSVIIPVDDYYVDYSDISISFIDEYLSVTVHLFEGQSYTINNGVDDVVTISLYETLGEYFISILSEGIETTAKPITLYLSTLDGVSQYSFNYIITDNYGGINSGLTPIIAYNPNLHGWINGNPYYEWFINLDTYWSGIDEFFILNEDNTPVFDSSTEVSIYERFYRNHLGYEMTALSPILNFKKNAMGNVVDYQVLDLFYEYENRNSEDVYGYFGFMIYDEFDVLVNTETYYFAPLILTGLNKYDGLPEKTISWDNRGDTYIINLFNVYDNLYVNTDYNYGRVVHDVKFFHESLFDFDRKTNTQYEPFYLNNGLGITLSDFVNEGDGLYSYDDSLFNIIVDTKLGMIYVTDKGLFNLVYEDIGLGLSRLRFFNYDVEMYVSNEELGGFVVSYDPFLDNGVFKTFMTGFEPEPPIVVNGGLFGGLGLIFRDLFPDADELDGYGKFSRIFFSLLLVIGFGVLLSFHSPENRGFIIPIISVISVMVLFFFIFIGYIPVWILIMSFLIGAGIIGVYIRKIGNSE